MSKLCSCVLLLAVFSVSASAQVVSQPDQHFFPRTLQAYQDVRTPSVANSSTEPEPVITQRVDLSKTITRFAEARQLDMTQARLQTLMFLELAPRAMGGQTKGTFRKIATDVFEITANKSFFDALPAMRQCLELGKKRVVVSLQTFAVAMEEAPEINGFLLPNSIKVHSAMLPKINPVATADQAEHGDEEATDDARSAKEFVATSSVVRENIPVTIGELTDQGVSELNLHVRHSKTATVLSNPSMNALPGQAATVNIMSYRPFVVALKTVTGKDGESRIEPVVQAIEDGTSIRVKAAPVGDRIHLMSDIAVSEVTDVSTYAYPDHAGGATIQIPRQSIRQVHLSSLVKPGNTILIDPHFNVEMTEKDEHGNNVKVKRKFLLTMRAQVVDMDDLSANVAALHQSLPNWTAR